MREYRTGPETPRLIHRALTVDDAEAALSFNGNPTVMEFTGEEPWPSLEETAQRLADYPAFDDDGFGRWGCLYKPEDKIIGFSGFRYLPELDEVDLGYRLLPEYWGRGLATESCRACLQFGFQVIGFDHIIALVLPQNARSIRVLEKIGMRDTGIIEIDTESAHRFVIEAGEWRAAQ
jgi:RimJ/RimL family protein N-acetyltransferase